MNDIGHVGNYSPYAISYIVFCCRYCCCWHIICQILIHLARFFIIIWEEKASDDNVWSGLSHKLYGSFKDDVFLRIQFNLHNFEINRTIAPFALRYFMARVQKLFLTFSPHIWNVGMYFFVNPQTNLLENFDIMSTIQFLTSNPSYLYQSINQSINHPPDKQAGDQKMMLAFTFSIREISEVKDSEQVGDLQICELQSRPGLRW